MLLYLVSQVLCFSFSFENVFSNSSKIDLLIMSGLVCGNFFSRSLPFFAFGLKHALVSPVGHTFCLKFCA